LSGRLQMPLGAMLWEDQTKTITRRITEVGEKGVSGGGRL